MNQTQPLTDFDMLDADVYKKLICFVNGPEYTPDDLQHWRFRFIESGGLSCLLSILINTPIQPELIPDEFMQSSSQALESHRLSSMPSSISSSMPSSMSSSSDNSAAASNNLNSSAINPYPHLPPRLLFLLMRIVFMFILNSSTSPSSVASVVAAQYPSFIRPPVLMEYVTTYALSQCPVSCICTTPEVAAHHTNEELLATTASLSSPISQIIVFFTRLLQLYALFACRLTMSNPFLSAHPTYTKLSSVSAGGSVQSQTAPNILSYSPFATKMRADKISEYSSITPINAEGELRESSSISMKELLSSWSGERNTLNTLLTETQEQFEALFQKPKTIAKTFAYYLWRNKEKSPNAAEGDINKERGIYVNSYQQGVNTQNYTFDEMRGNLSFITDRSNLFSNQFCGSNFSSLNKMFLRKKFLKKLNGKEAIPALAKTSTSSRFFDKLKSTQNLSVSRQLESSRIFGADEGENNFRQMNLDDLNMSSQDIHKFSLLPSREPTRITQRLGAQQNKDTKVNVKVDEFFSSLLPEEIAFRLIFAFLARYQVCLFPLLMKREGHPSLFLLLSGSGRAVHDEKPAEKEEGKQERDRRMEGAIQSLLNLLSSVPLAETDEFIADLQRAISSGNFEGFGENGISSSGYVVCSVLGKIAEELIPIECSSGFGAKMLERFFKVFMLALRAQPSLKARDGNPQYTFNSARFLTVFSHLFVDCEEIYDNYSSFEQQSSSSAAASLLIQKQSGELNASWLNRNALSSSMQIVPSVSSASFSDPSNPNSNLFARSADSSCSSLLTLASAVLVGLRMLEWDSNPDDAEMERSLREKEQYIKLVLGGSSYSQMSSASVALIPFIMSRILIDFGDKKCPMLPPYLMAQFSPSLRVVLLSLLVSLCRNDALPNSQIVLSMLVRLQGLENKRVFPTFNTNPSQTSKATLGYMGIRNNGSLCYMISVLIQLFMHPQFRLIVMKYSGEECGGWTSHKEEATNSHHSENRESLVHSHDMTSNFVHFDPNAPAYGSLSGRDQSTFFLKSSFNQNIPYQPAVTSQQLYSSTHFVSHFGMSSLRSSISSVATRHSNNQGNNEPPEFAKRRQKTWEELRSLFCVLDDASVEAAELNEFLSVFEMYDGVPLDPSVQQDAVEFFLCLMDQAQQHLKKMKAPDAVDRLFGGLSCEQRICEAGHVNTQADHWMTVGVEVLGYQSLEDSLRAHVEGDIVEDAICSSCGKKTKMAKRSLLQELPNTIVFGLKRFQFDRTRQRFVKVNDHFEFPLTDLDIGPFMKEVVNETEKGIRDSEMYSQITRAIEFSKKNSPDNPHSHPFFVNGTAKRDFPELNRSSDYYKYELVGVICHDGGAEGGHYYSFVKERCAPNRWLLFNDASVKEIDPSCLAEFCFGGIGDDQELQKIYEGGAISLDALYKSYSAFMLFYQRKNPQDDWAKEKQEKKKHDGLYNQLLRKSGRLTHDELIKLPFPPSFPLDTLSEICNPSMNMAGSSSLLSMEQLALSPQLLSMSPMFTSYSSSQATLIHNSQILSNRTIRILSEMNRGKLLFNKEFFSFVQTMYYFLDCPHFVDSLQNATKINENASAGGAPTEAEQTQIAPLQQMSQYFLCFVWPSFVFHTMGHSRNISERFDEWIVQLERIMLCSSQVASSWVNLQIKQMKKDFTKEAQKLMKMESESSATALELLASSSPRQKCDSSSVLKAYLFYANNEKLQRGFLRVMLCALKGVAWIVENAISGYNETSGDGFSSNTTSIEEIINRSPQYIKDIIGILHSFFMSLLLSLSGMQKKFRSLTAFFLLVRDCCACSPLLATIILGCGFPQRCFDLLCPTEAPHFGWSEKTAVVQSRDGSVDSVDENVPPFVISQSAALGNDANSSSSSSSALPSQKDSNRTAVNLGPYGSQATTVVAAQSMLLALNACFLNAYSSTSSECIRILGLKHSNEVMILEKSEEDEDEEDKEATAFEERKKHQEQQMSDPNEFANLQHSNEKISLLNAACKLQNSDVDIESNEYNHFVSASYLRKLLMMTQRWNRHVSLFLCLSSYVPSVLPADCQSESEEFSKASNSLEHTLSCLLSLISSSRQNKELMEDSVSMFFDLITMQTFDASSNKYSSDYLPAQPFDDIRKRKMIQFLQFVAQDDVIKEEATISTCLTALNWYLRRSKPLALFIGTGADDCENKGYAFRLILHCAIRIQSKPLRELAVRIIRFACVLDERDVCLMKPRYWLASDAPHPFELPLPRVSEYLAKAPFSYRINCFPLLSFNGDLRLGVQRVDGEAVLTARSIEERELKKIQLFNISSFLLGKPLILLRDGKLPKLTDIKREEDTMELDSLYIPLFPGEAFCYDWTIDMQPHQLAPHRIPRYEFNENSIGLFSYAKWDDPYPNRAFISSFMSEERKDTPHPTSSQYLFVEDALKSEKNEMDQNAGRIKIKKKSKNDENELAIQREEGFATVKKHSQATLLGVMIEMVESQFNSELSHLLEFPWATVKEGEMHNDAQSGGQQNHTSSFGDTAGLAFQKASFPSPLSLPFSTPKGKEDKILTTDLTKFSLDSFFALFNWLLMTKTLEESSSGCSSACSSVAACSSSSASSEKVLSQPLLSLVDPNQFSENFCRVLVEVAGFTTTDYMRRTDLNRLAAIRFISRIAVHAPISERLWKCLMDQQSLLYPLDLPKDKIKDLRMKMFCDELCYSFFSMVLLLCERNRKGYEQLFSSFVALGTARSILLDKNTFLRSSPLLAILIAQFCCFAPLNHYYLCDLLFDEKDEIPLNSELAASIFHLLYFPRLLLPNNFNQLLQSNPLLLYRTNKIKCLFDLCNTPFKPFPFPRNCFLSLHSLTFVESSSPSAQKQEQSRKSGTVAAVMNDESIEAESKVSQMMFSSMKSGLTLESIGKRQMSLINMCISFMKLDEHITSTVSLIRISNEWIDDSFLRKMDYQHLPLTLALDVVDAFITDWFRDGIAGSTYDLSAVLAKEYNSIFGTYSPIEGERTKQLRSFEEDSTDALDAGSAEWSVQKSGFTTPHSNFKSQEEIVLYLNTIEHAVYFLSTLTCCAFPLCVRVKALRLIVMLLPMMKEVENLCDEHLLDALLVSFNSIYTNGAKSERSLSGGTFMSTYAREQNSPNPAACDRSNIFFANCLLTNMILEFSPGSEDCIPFSYLYTSRNVSQRNASSSSSSSSSSFVAPSVNNALAELFWRWQLFLVLSVLHLCTNVCIALDGMHAQFETVTPSQKPAVICPPQFDQPQTELDRRFWLRIKMMRLTEVTLFGLFHTHPITTIVGPVPWNPLFENITDFVHYPIKCVSDHIINRLFEVLSFSMSVFGAGSEQCYAPATALFDPLLNHLMMRHPSILAKAIQENTIFNLFSKYVSQVVAFTPTETSSYLQKAFARNLEDVLKEINNNTSSLSPVRAYSHQHSQSFYSSIQILKLFNPSILPVKAIVDAHFGDLSNAVGVLSKALASYPTEIREESREDTANIKKEIEDAKKVLAEFAAVCPSSFVPQNSTFSAQKSEYPFASSSSQQNFAFNSTFQQIPGNVQHSYQTAYPSSSVAVTPSSASPMFLQQPGSVVELPPPFSFGGRAETSSTPSTSSSQLSSSMMPPPNKGSPSSTEAPFSRLPANTHSGAGSSRIGERKVLPQAHKQSASSSSSLRKSQVLSKPKTPITFKAFNPLENTSSNSISRAAPPTTFSGSSLAPLTTQNTQQMFSPAPSVPSTQSYPSHPSLPPPPPKPSPSIASPSIPSLTSYYLPSNATGTTPQ